MRFLWKLQNVDWENIVTVLVNDKSSAAQIQQFFKAWKKTRTIIPRLWIGSNFKFSRSHFHDLPVKEIFIYTETFQLKKGMTKSLSPRLPFLENFATRDLSFNHQTKELIEWMLGNPLT